MSVKCQTITNLIEQFAPRNLAEDWDNVGLQVGNPVSDINAVLVTLDVNRQVVDEAVSVGANLIISHHPLIFKPVKNIRSDSPQGSLLTELIKNEISVFCAHTNMDSAAAGVNQTLANLFELRDVEVLNPDKIDAMNKLVVFVPASHSQVVREALSKAGAGWIGKYSDCAFSVTGTGTFKAVDDDAKPFIGQIGQLEEVPEVRIETVVREKEVNRVIRAMLKAHPYEEVAYDIYPLRNDAGRLGLGRIGILPEKLTMKQFMDQVKVRLRVSTLRYGGDSDSEIHKVALCGGSGSSLLNRSAFLGADVFLSGDIKYHEAQEAISLGLNFVDAGHFATEVPIVQKVAELLKKSLRTEGITVHVATSNVDSFNYY